MSNSMHVEHLCQMYEKNFIYRNNRINKRMAHYYQPSSICLNRVKRVLFESFKLRFADIHLNCLCTIKEFSTT